MQLLKQNDAVSDGLARREGLRVYRAGGRWQRTSAGRVDRWLPAAEGGAAADPACGVADRQTGRSDDCLKGFVLHWPSGIYANKHKAFVFRAGDVI